MSTSQKPAERRVVITGVGLVSPLGSDPASYATALAEGRSGVTRRPDGDAWPTVGGFAPQFTGAIGDFGDLQGSQKKAIRKGLKLMCRETQMAVAAAQHAIAHSGGLEGADPERVGVVLGSDYMLTLPDDYADAIQKCSDAGDFDFDRWGGDGLDQMTPLWMLKYLPNMPASHIAIYNDLRGPNNSLTLREAGGLMAIGEAFRILARGGADRMIAGATGTRVLPMQAIHAHQHHQALGDAAEDEDPATLSRPFDAASRGMVCGEGSGMLMLETLDSAESRGATVLGELVGFGSGVATKPTANGDSLAGDNRVALANALTASLADAGLGGSALGHINADGLGTPEADREEAAAINDVLGDSTVPVVALKSYFGALGAGSGVVELIGSLLAMDPTGLLAGALPRSLNGENTDKSIRVVTDTGQSAGDAFAKLSVTPQGQAAAVCVKRL